jgi:hypothetical protein
LRGEKVHKVNYENKTLVYTFKARNQIEEIILDAVQEVITEKLEASGMQTYFMNKNCIIHYNDKNIEDFNGNSEFLIKSLLQMLEKYQYIIINDDMQNKLLGD